MPAEISGNQIRIRMKDPELFSEWGTDDVGSPGKIQRVAGKNKRTGNWETQSWRINLNDYSNVNEVISEIKKLKEINGSQKYEAIKLAKEYFK